MSVSIDLQNLNEKIIAIKPSITLKVIIHPPDFGKDFNLSGNII